MQKYKFYGQPTYGQILNLSNHFRIDIILRYSYSIIHINHCMYEFIAKKQKSQI